MGSLTGQVPFPEAGDGAFIKFGWRDLAELEERHGATELFGYIERGANNASASVVMEVLELTLKTNKDGQPKPVKLNWDEVEWPVSLACPKIMDALCIAQTGKPYAETIDEALEQAAKIKAQAEAEAAKKGDDPLADSGGQSE
ncbi:MAG: hypothetical protein AAF468_20190 [Pseudomonadota bacterium]